MSQTIDVKKVVDEQQIRGFQATMIAFSFFVTMIDSFDAFSIAYVAPLIVGEWRLPPAAFTSVFTANVAGLAFGAMIFGLIADRLGNKKILIVSLVLIGVLTYAKAFCTSVTSLAVLQFFAALAVGGIYPIALSIVAESSPLRRRPAMLIVTSLGFSLGASLAGFIAGPLIANFGWRSMFYLGGVLPLMLAVIAMAVVPESVEKMVHSGASRERIVEALSRIAPSLQILPETRFTVSDAVKSRVPVAQLFAEGRAAVTVTLWIGFIAAFMVYYFLFSWLPILLNSAGMAINQSLIGGAVYPAGGFVGCLLFAYLSGRRRISSIVSALFAVSALSIVLVGFVSSSVIIPTLFLVGIGSLGGILASNTLVSLVYPSEIRSAGIGWAFGLGRAGSMLGPVLGGVMLSQQLLLSTMCFVIAVPAVVSALAFVTLGRLRSSI